MDATQVMRGFHSMIRSQLMDETKDEDTREKLWGLNYLSGLSLDSQTINIPSNFLLPVLKPSNLSQVDSKESDASSHDGKLSSSQKLSSYSPHDISSHTQS